MRGTWKLIATCTFWCRASQGTSGLMRPAYLGHIQGTDGSKHTYHPGTSLERVRTASIIKIQHSKLQQK